MNTAGINNAGRRTSIGLRSGVHKSESAKEMLLSQNMFGPLPPSPPATMSSPEVSSDCWNHICCGNTVYTNQLPSRRVMAFHRCHRCRHHRPTLITNRCGPNRPPPSQRTPKSDHPHHTAHRPLAVVRIRARRPHRRPHRRPPVENPPPAVVNDRRAFHHIGDHRIQRSKHGDFKGSPIAQFMFNNVQLSISPKTAPWMRASVDRIVRPA